MVKRLTTVFFFYRDGFREMTIGKRLWGIILLKLFIMFAVLKVFFFPNFLNSNFQTDQEKSSHVIDQLTRQTSYEGGGKATLWQKSP